MPISRKDKNRVPLDPYQWAGFAANHVRQPEQPDVVQPASQPVQQTMPETACPKLRLVREMINEEQANNIVAKRQTAIDKWHSAVSGGGNAAFFQLGVDLRSTGMNLSEIEAILRQESGQARHPGQRRDQVKSIIRTLSQRSGRAVA